MSHGWGRKCRAMFESAQQPMFLVNAGGAALPNATAAGLFGMGAPCAEVPLSELVPRCQPDGHDSGRVMAWRARAALQGWPQSFPWRFCRRDGVLFDSTVSLARAEWAGPGALSMIVDLHPAPWGPDRNQKTKDGLIRLAGGVAHDFNNLLMAIMGHVQLLGMREHDAEDQDSLGQIERAAERAAEITRKLLVYSGRQQRTECRADLNELVRGMRDRLQKLVEGTPITMRLAACPGNVLVDASQLEQAVMAVVLNAREAMASGGTIDIETSSYLAPPGLWAVLSISDSGPGMEPADCARAFEPYFSTHECGVGVGLGLAAVDGVIRHSGGHVEARSRPGGGTTVTIYLPRV